MRLKILKKIFQIYKTKYCVGCANGSDALYLAIKSLNLKKMMKLLFLI